MHEFIRLQDDRRLSLVAGEEHAIGQNGHVRKDVRLTGEVQDGQLLLDALPEQLDVAVGGEQDRGAQAAHIVTRGHAQHPARRAQSGEPQMLELIVRQCFGQTEWRRTGEPHEPDGGAESELLVGELFGGLSLRPVPGFGRDPRQGGGGAPAGRLRRGRSAALAGGLECQQHCGHDKDQVLPRAEHNQPCEMTR